MFASRSLSLLLIFAGSALAIKDPDWKLGTVLDAQALRPRTEMELPVYSPGGQAIASLPDIQHIALEGTQRLILGEDFAFIVNPAAARPRRASKHACNLSPGDEVMYFESKGELSVLDSDAELCTLAVVRRENLAKK